MQEVLKYLRANSYKTFIVTGGGQEFACAYSEAIYGISPEQVVGTAGGAIYDACLVRHAHERRLEATLRVRAVNLSLPQ